MAIGRAWLARRIGGWEAEKFDACLSWVIAFGCHAHFHLQSYLCIFALFWHELASRPVDILN